MVSEVLPRITFKKLNSQSQVLENAQKKTEELFTTRPCCALARKEAEVAMATAGDHLFVKRVAVLSFVGSPAGLSVPVAQSTIPYLRGLAVS